MAQQHQPVRRTVYARAPQEWVNEGAGSGEGSTVHRSREEATAEAEQMIRRGGGGFLTVKNPDGEEERKHVSPREGAPASISRGSEDEASFKVRDALAHDEHAMSDPVRDDESAPILKGADKSRIRPP
jgi:hypothetical protein